jgi:hypothetical protein
VRRFDKNATTSTLTTRKETADQPNETIERQKTKSQRDEENRNSEREAKKEPTMPTPCDPTREREEHNKHRLEQNRLKISKRLRINNKHATDEQTASQAHQETKKDCIVLDGVVKSTTSNIDYNRTKETTSRRVTATRTLTLNRLQEEENKSMSSNCKPTPCDRRNEWQQEDWKKCAMTKRVESACD